MTVAPDGAGRDALYSMIPDTTASKKKKQRQQDSRRSISTRPSTMAPPACRGPPNQRIKQADKHRRRSQNQQCQHPDVTAPGRQHRDQRPVQTIRPRADKKEPKQIGYRLLGRQTNLFLILTHFPSHRLPLHNGHLLLFKDTKRKWDKRSLPLLSAFA